MKIRQNGKTHIQKLETDLPVSVISRKVGFEDASYFTRLFKKLTGVTPREYRISVLGLGASVLDTNEGYQNVRSD